jgi:hypothetical protein
MMMMQQIEDILVVREEIFAMVESCVAVVSEAEESEELALELVEAEELALHELVAPEVLNRVLERLLQRLLHAGLLHIYRLLHILLEEFALDLDALTSASQLVV